MVTFPYVLTLGIFILSTGFVEIRGYSCEGQTIYGEHESRLSVYCDSPIVNFIAVFWYRETTTTAPFLRLENNRKTPEEGYDITDNGTMVIEELRSEQAGLYIHRMVSNDGKSHDMNITINVKVSLKTNPLIEECASSIHDVCNSVERTKRKNTLLCIAGEARPPVNIAWTTLDRKQRISVKNTNSLNRSTSLYTSTSLLEYNPDEFKLEYITCDVTGEAAQDAGPVGMFVKGSNKDNEFNEHKKYIKIGSDIMLDCPELPNNKLGEWRIVYPNKTYHLLWRKYPKYESPCDIDSCYIEKNGSMTIRKVKLSNEGNYVCTFNDGSRVIPVEVHISPEPMHTVIAGCDETDQCELNVANTWSLACSIIGSRPSIKPVVNVDEAVTDVFLFGFEHTIKEGVQPGTYDTTLDFKYEISKCSDVVRIECLPDNNSHEDKISKSVVNLKTSTIGCGKNRGRPGLAVCLVLVVIIVVVCFVKREYISQKLHTFGQRRGKPEGKEREYPSLDTKVKVKERLKIFEGLLETGKVSLTEYISLIGNLVQKGEVSFTEYISLLGNLVQKGEVSPTKYISLIGYLVQKREIELSRYVELTGSLLNENIVEFDLIISALKNMVDKKYLSREKFSSTLLRYYIGHYISEDTLINELSGETTSYMFLSPYVLQSTYKRFQEKNDLKSTKGTCYIFKKLWDQLMGETLQLPINLDNDSKKKGETQPSSYSENIINEEENEPFLDSSGDSKNENNKDEIQHLGSKNTTNEGEPSKLPESIDEKFDKDSLNKALQRALIQALVFSMDSNMIETDEGVEMIQNTKLPQEEFEELISNYTEMDLTSEDNVMKLLEQTLAKKMISDDVYVNSMWHFVNPKRKITFNNYMENLKESLKHKLVSEKCFEQQVTKLITNEENKEHSKKQKKKVKSGKKQPNSEAIGANPDNTFTNYWDGNQWIRFVAKLTIDEVIGPGLRITLLQHVVSTRQMKEDDVKEFVKYDMGIGVNERGTLLEKVNFKK